MLILVHSFCITLLVRLTYCDMGIYGQSLQISAKTGTGIASILETIVEDLPW